MSKLSENSNAQQQLSAAGISGVAKPNGEKAHDHTEALLRAIEEIRNLKRILAEKNRLLQSVSSAIDSFNNVATDQYKFNLENLYSRLEFILNGDAANLSNNGKANLRKMQGTIQKMKLVTEDIIYISQIYSLDKTFQEVDLKQICRIAKKGLKEKIEEYGFELNCDELPKIKGFPLLLVPLFHHLILNALKMRNAAEPGKLSIFCDTVKKYEEEFGTERTYHKISFLDNGIGFPEENKDQIFNLLYYMNNDSYKRIGINLPVAKKIMDLHHGYITARHTPAGTSFNCYFPAESIS